MINRPMKSVFQLAEVYASDAGWAADGAQRDACDARDACGARREPLHRAGSSLSA